MDELGAVFEASSEYPAAGAMGLPKILTTATNASSGPSIDSHCKDVAGESCSTQKLDDNIYIVSIKSRPQNAIGYCNTATCYSGSCSPRTWLTGSGSVPQAGFADGPLSLAKFNKPFDFAPGNRAGTYYVADFGNNIVRFVDLEVGNVSTVAGNQSVADNGDGGLATSASMIHPRGVVVDTDGSFYVSTEKGYIRKVSPDGRIRAFAGKPTTSGGILADLTTFDQLALSNPSGMVIDKEKAILYVADTGHHRILSLDLNKNLAKVVAGNGTCVPGDTLAGKVALEISFCSPEKIALDSNGNLLVLDQVNKRIRRINFTSPNDGLLQYKPLAKDNSILYRNASGEFNLSYRDGSQTVFNANGLQIETSDRTGRIYHFDYNEDKQLTNVRFPTGQEMALEYSGSRLSQITDPAGRTTQFVSADGKIERVIYPDNSQRQFAYHENGILFEEKDQLGFATTYELNNFNRLKAVHRPDNTVIQVSDALSQSIHEGEETGPQELKSFQNEENRLQDIISDAKGIETTFSWDTNGYIDTITDHEGRVTKVERDSEGRPIKIIRHDNTYSTLTYSPTFGDLISRYDSSSNSSETYLYDQWGHLTNFTNSLGQSKQAIYDANTGLLIQEIDYLGKVASRTYGNLGLLASVTNPSGETSGIVYNSQGNIAQLLNPKGEATTIVRDDAGNVVSKTNAKGEVTVYEIDEMNRLSSVKTSKNLITRYTYSPRGDLLGILDQEGNQTSFQYDSLKRVIRKTSSLGQVWQINYDGNGNVVQEIDPKGQLKTFTYNSDNRLVVKSLPDDVYRMSYDDRGNLLTLANNVSSISMSYVNVAGEDSVHNITTSGTGLPTISVDHVYNNLGNRTQINTNVGSWTTNFYANGRISGVNGPNSMDYTFGFDNANRLTNISRAGSSTSISFDAASFVSQVLHQRSGTNISTFVYQRDLAGNRTQIQSMLGNTLLSYDSEGQLVFTSLPELEEIFSYDNLGNRVSDNSGNFSYDEKKYRLTEDYAFIYAWDENGNLITKQSKGMSGLVYNFSYTSQNQLKLVQIYEGTALKKEVSFMQDALGRRIKKEVIDHENSNKSFVRKFAYDGEEIIAVFDTDDVLLARYTHSGMRTDDVLGVEITSEGAIAGLALAAGRYQFLKDALGSITDITDNAGNVLQRYSYSGFGKILKIVDAAGIELSAPILKTHFAFTNREWDEEIGLYHYRARAYDPAQGRFLTEDPHPGDATRPITLINKYVYAGNNPTKNKDPSGKIFGVDDLIIIGAFAVAGGILEGSNKGWTLDNVFVGMLKGAALGASFIGVSSLLGAASSVGAGGGAFTGAMAPSAGSVLLAGALAIPAGVGMFASGAPSWTKEWAKGYAIAGFAGNLLRAGVWISEMNGYEAALNDSVIEGMPADEQADIMSFINAGYRIGDFMLFSAGLSLIPLGLK